MHIIPECCICRLSLKNNLCVEKNCGNVFHYSCMKQWIGVQKSCPLCKSTCCKKNLLFIHYEINEENKMPIMDENYLNKNKNELYEDLVKFEAELIKTKNENEKYSFEILTLTNKNKILSDTISQNNIKMDQEKKEKLKLKELKDEYLKDKILLSTKIQEYDKELNKYKTLEKYLNDLNKEDLNKINLLFGLNVLTIEEQKNVILNYLNNCLSTQKKNEAIVKQLREDLTQKDEQIQNLKEKLYTYKLKHDITEEDTFDRQSVDGRGENDMKTIKIKSKVIRRVKTLDSGMKADGRRPGPAPYSKSKTSGTNVVGSNELSGCQLSSSQLCGGSRNNSQDFLNFIDKKINNTPEHINVTPRKRKFHSIEVDLFRNKSVDKFFSDLAEKNNSPDCKDLAEVYSIPTDSGNTKSSQSSFKPPTGASSSLKQVHAVKANKGKSRKSYTKQSTKITDFFRRL
ncbi:RING zinc finger protein, putative [Plasmodium vivax]|uniref:RING-type domain-containing protein n=3 Tax=Plasmodium vivax TaxID=5855 RepID=A5K7Y6_PLAVS|nr:hypothetical protein, conserved [Plasmodium vivax]EDL44400.1 hypothetical protein, conserved [Plasmodium vivax]KMZ85467.1 hypothetical protein PVBG_02153 [Plasmodium vivax Brazil I]KMZ91343.1 hypothetical protein PVMG_00217 [Plasmodium vivax Mauritania I]CAI7722014.1 RING zinc finger protein, putative [Plasmodium vivax]|eukprot:XP_001614127.1 hypothetical protein [Plasmodium vivax Sal-1]